MQLCAKKKDNFPLQNELLNNFPDCQNMDFKIINNNELISINMNLVEFMIIICDAYEQKVLKFESPDFFNKDN